jgi:hypothetical protein
MLEMLRPTKLWNVLGSIESVFLDDVKKFTVGKIMFFRALCKIPKRWIYHTTTLILGPNSVFGLWRLIFALLTPKSIFFLTPCKILDRWIYHTTILILGPKFRFWALGASFTFLTPKSTYFLHLYTISDRLMGHMTYGIFQNAQLSAQPKDPADFKFFLLRTLSIKL